MFVSEISKTIAEKLTVNFFDIQFNLSANLHLPLRGIFRSELSASTTTPLDTLKNSVEGLRNDFAVVLTHGLGARDPQQKDASNDEWIPLIAAEALSTFHSIAMYTARGHGFSSGWEDTAESDPSQFTWDRLSSDMAEVVDIIGVEKVIVGGSSMGSATSLYYAMHHPERVLGVVMIRPPTAWAERFARRKTLLGSAEKCRKAHETDSELSAKSSYLVLQGTAYSDFPSIEDTTLYTQVTCPVLILAVADDDAHPVSTAITLSTLLPHATLVIANDRKEALSIWPNLIHKFFEDLIEQTRSESK
jgi:3-oxoadipate enol-lactonase